MYRGIFVCFLICFWLLVVQSSWAIETCYNCHKETKEQYSGLKIIHQPVNEENCESCHKPHGFAQKLILKDSTSDLCYTCHGDLRESYSKGSVHFPVSNGKCWDCHNPHGSNVSGMLREDGEQADFCQRCHQQEVDKALGKEFIHIPFEGMECPTCHAPHNSVNGALLISDVKTLCSECHDTSDNTWQQVHTENHAGNLPCSECHSAHSSDSKGLLVDDAHSPFAGGECDLCHSTPDASGAVTFEEGTTPGQICAACHDDIVEKTTKTHPHAAVEADNCDNCHNPHSSRFGSLLRTDEATLCGECHAEVLTGEGKTPHKPVVTGGCGSCHEIHGSDRPSLVKASDASLCLGCHDDFAKNQEAASTVHAAVDDCLGCHSPHEGVDNGILRKDPKDLCADCHEVDSEALSAISGHQPYLTGNCSDCHSAHFSQAAHLVRGGTEMCLGCHVDIDKLLNLPVPHPAAADECQTCHAPHYSQNKRLLTADDKDLCSSCHDYDELNMSSAFVHTSAREGDCSGCHNPHGSKEAKLVAGRTTKVEVGGMTVGQQPNLTGLASDLCYTCHNDLAETFSKDNAHAPVAEGSCDVCHAAHGSDYPGFVIAATPELCSNCHSLDEALLAAHEGYDLTTTDCLDCHNPHVSKQPKLVRDVAHPPFAEQSCDACHERNAENKVELLGSMSEVCSSCHESVSEGLEMTNVHGPFGGDDCGGCHRLHAGDRLSLLKAEGSALCLSCHEDLKDTAKLPVNHPPFAEGKCLECHRPHASPYPALATVAPEDFCFSCHENVKLELDQGEPHAPVMGGECGSCHEAHAGSVPALLLDTKVTLCGQCHEVDSEDLKQKHGGFSLENVDCQNCHAAHATPSGSTGLLLPDTHAPFADGDCSICHDGPHADKLVETGNQLCTGCHDDFVGGAAPGAVIHAPLKREKGCVACHRPHVGYGTTLQAKKGVQACLGCHDGKEFKGSVQHAVAFEDCANCHQPHTSAYKGLLATADIIELCQTCHEGAEKTHYHPMGTRVIDPKTGKTLNCVSCHSPHSSDHATILVAEKDKDLCVTCHAPSRKG